MSGGHFGDYDYYKVHQFADELEVEIHSVYDEDNNTDDLSNGIVSVRVEEKQK